ncbi:MAG: hypothetical protein FJ087_21470 [Deltaproteobacteria bacterium]|nr:hypothetical protein [Deltaproteobacteria bacterium]
MTPGVLGRVEQLADRPEGPVPAHFPPQWSLIPLAEVLCELLECGPASQALDRAYERTLARLGPELDLLGRTDVADVEREGGGLLASAIRRMRSGRVHLEAGYDGEYGVVRVFAPGEVARLKGQGFMFADDAPRRKARTRTVAVPDAAPAAAREDLFAAPDDPTARGRLSPEQPRAVQQVLP